MMHSFSYDDGPFRNMDSSSENVPLLRDPQPVAGYDGLIHATDETLEGEEGGVPRPEQVEMDEENEDQTPARPSGASVTCRVCDATIDLNGKGKQHVVKCPSCHEATPIKPAPAGKKYVRCPCNCLLICKAPSTRIACPRANCRRVITLARSNPMGMAVRAPAGSCRVDCAHCNQVFMFNTLTNTLATCPHCRKSSSVGASFARTRSFMFLAAAVVALMGCVLITVLTSSRASSYPFIYALWAFLYGCSAYLFYRFLFYYMVKVSTVVGPV